MRTRASWTMWWSGLFGMLTLGHVARLATGAVVIVGRHAVPLWVSQVIAPIAGLLWLGLLARAHRAERCGHAAPARRSALESQGQTGDREVHSCDMPAGDRGATERAVGHGFGI